MMLNPEPKVAIFLNKADYQDYIEIMIDGQKWVVGKKQTRVMKEALCS